MIYLDAIHAYASVYKPGLIVVLGETAWRKMVTPMRRS